MSSLVLVGVSHHRAPVELRERAALGRDDAAALAKTLADDGEAVCLSTCNRTELYLACESGDDAERRAGGALLAPQAQLGPAPYPLRGEGGGPPLLPVPAGP